MPKRRRLRKSEANLVNRAVDQVYPSLAQHLREIERLVTEDFLPLIPDDPPDLRTQAEYKIMDRLGQDLFTGFELTRLLAEEQL